MKPRVTLAASAVAIVMASAFFAWFYRDVTRALEHHKATTAIARAAAEMQVAAFEAMLAPGPAIETQWRARNDALTAMLAGLQVTSQQGPVDEVRQQHERLVTHFPGFVRREPEATTGFIGASRQFVSEAFALSGRSHALVEDSRRRVVWFVALFMVVLGAIVAGTWRLGTRRFQAAQATLIESREEFRALVTTASDAIVSADSQGRITFFNRAAELMFGYDAKEAMGQPLTQLMPERFKPLHEAGFQRFLATGESRIIDRTVEVIGRHRGAAEFPMEISIAAWTTSGKTSFTAILRDVSARHASVEALRKVNEELESFSYTVSHDLRAPLRHIAGYTGLLSEQYGPALDPAGRRYFQLVSQSVGQMDRLIDDLLAFSRMGRSDLRHEDVDMSGLVGQVLAGMEEETQGRRILWDIQPLASIRGDGALLQQVWVNLLSNAIKYTRLRDEARIAIGSAEKGPAVEYFVRDNGIGFDMAHAGKLFGVFQRLHGAGDFEGTGVGLANVKRIVARHGGTVTAHGKAGEGATFCFSLPRSGVAPERGSG